MLWSRSLLLGTVVSTLALGTGCISQDELEERLDEVDDDGDGDPNGTDCATDDPDRSTNQAETAYDGVDNDCGQDGDLVDQDGDGYPGIDYEEWAALAGDNAEDNWPESVTKDEVDCDDLDATINPGEDETHYDGIDQACNGDDDEYDRDEDGYVHEDYADVYEGDLPATDCDDDDETTYPGADDTWYDGVDSDCGLDNDYDQDGDGWAASGYEDDLAVYESKYGYGLDTDATGDCDDEDTSIYPGASDDWYDGIDSDCAADNDYDADVDGWTPDAYASDLADYESTYGYGLDTSAVGDCDDADDSVHPQTLEFLDDGVDQDCDGDEDSTAFTYSSYSWDTPRRPHVGADDYNYLLVTGATEFEGVSEVGTALVFDMEPTWGHTPYDTTNWHTASSSATLHDDVDVVFVDDGFYAATSYASSNKSVLITYYHQWSTSDESYSRASNGFANHSATSTAVHSRIDLIEASNGDTIALGCGDGLLQMIQGEYSGGGISRGEGDYDSVSASYTDCFVEEVSTSSYYAELSTGSDVDAYGFDTSSGLTGTASSQPWSGESMDYIVHEGDWVVWTDASGGIVLDDGNTSYSLLTSYDVEGVDIAWDGDEIFVAIVDTNGDFTLAYGDTGALTEVAFDLSDEDGNTVAGLYPSIHVDDDYVVLAHSGFGDSSDMVGWTFIGR